MNRFRLLLIGTGIVAAILGAVVAYLVLTVPNDLEAGRLLKSARQDAAAGRNDEARESLSKIVQNYPRTDAAAAATVALMTIADEERAKLSKRLAALEKEQQSSVAASKGLQQQLEELNKKAVAPPPVAPPQVAPPPPAPAPAPRPIVKKAPVKKVPSKARSSTRRKRR